MRLIQQMMVENEAIDTNNERVIFPQLIKAKFPSSSGCHIPLCTACELAQAKRRNPEVTKLTAIKDKEDILAAGAVEPGDFVSMDQFICKTPGQLPTG